MNVIHFYYRYLQLWFKCLNDINDNISYLRQLGGSSVQVYCDSLAKELSYGKSITLEVKPDLNVEMFPGILLFKHIFCC